MLANISYQIYTEKDLCIHLKREEVKIYIALIY